MSKVYDRKSIGDIDEVTAVSADKEIVKRKASLRSINDRHEPMPTAEIATKPSLRMTRDKLEPSRPGEALVETFRKPSDTKLNISKSLQSTRTSDSSLLRNTKKREVRRGF
jgi:hypothetical protein